MKTKDYYSRIPNDFFYGESVIKNTNKNILMVFDSLYMRKGLDGIIGTSLEYIVEYCGYKPNRNKGKSNEIIKEALMKLEELGYIEFLDDTKLLPRNFILVKFNVDLETDYTMLKRSEVEKILSTKSTLDKHNLVNVYMYLKSRMYTREKGDSLIMNGGIPETCFPTYEKIVDDIGICRQSVSKCVEELVELNLIRYANCGKWYNPNETENGRVKWRKCNNLYTLFTKDESIYKNTLKEAKKNQKKYYESLGRKFK